MHLGFVWILEAIHIKGELSCLNEIRDLNGGGKFTSSVYRFDGKKSSGVQKTKLFADEIYIGLMCVSSVTVEGNTKNIKRAIVLMNDFDHNN